MSTFGRLPVISLPAALTGDQVNLSGGRGPRAIVVVHLSCTQCRDFIRELGDASESITEWGGRVCIVVSERVERGSHFYESIPAAFQLLADPDCCLGLSPPTLVIADEWGEIYFKLEAGSDHAFATPTEIAEWIQFLAIQCPECEQPEGEWKSI